MIQLENYYYYLISFLPGEVESDDLVSFIQEKMIPTEDDYENMVNIFHLRNLYWADQVKFLIDAALDVEKKILRSRAKVDDKGQ